MGFYLPYCPLCHAGGGVGIELHGRKQTWKATSEKTQVNLIGIQDFVIKPFLEPPYPWSFYQVEICVKGESGVMPGRPG